MFGDPLTLILLVCSLLDVPLIVFSVLFVWNHSLPGHAFTSDSSIRCPRLLISSISHPPSPSRIVSTTTFIHDLTLAQSNAMIIRNIIYAIIKSQPYPFQTQCADFPSFFSFALDRPFSTQLRLLDTRFDTCLVLTSLFSCCPYHLYLPLEETHHFIRHNVFFLFPSV